MSAPVFRFGLAIVSSDPRLSRAIERLGRTFYFGRDYEFSKGSDCWAAHLPSSLRFSVPKTDGAKLRRITQMFICNTLTSQAYNPDQFFL
jgi:hypothetical protein